MKSPSFNRVVSSKFIAALALSVVAVSQGQAGETNTQIVAAQEKEESLLDKIWALPVIYENKDAVFFQRFAFTGRYHGDFFTLDSNQGDESDWEHRRVRIGAAVKFTEQWDADVEFNLNVENDGGRFVQNLEQLRLRYRPTKTFSLSAGRIKPPVSYEFRQSSNQFDFIERSLIINQAVHGRQWGILAEGKQGQVLWGAGAYNTAEDGDWNWPEFDGGALLFGSVGYEFDKNHVLSLDYAYQTDYETRYNTRPYEHVAALWFNGKTDRFGYRIEGIFADGYGSTPAAYGVIVTPTYDLIPDKLRAVLRYQYADSDKTNGVSLQRRYEREAPDLVTSRASNYHAIYGGLNYYIYGDKLKIQAGVEYATADQSGGGSFESVTGLAALRFSF